MWELQCSKSEKQTSQRRQGSLNAAQNTQSSGPTSLIFPIQEKSIEANLSPSSKEPSCWAEFLTGQVSSFRDPLVQSLNPGQSLGTWKAGVTLYLSFYSSIPPSIHLPTRPSTQASIIHPSYSFIYPSFLPSPTWPIHHLSIHPSIFPSFIHLLTHPSFILPFIQLPSIHHPSIHPSFLQPPMHLLPLLSLY